MVKCNFCGKEEHFFKGIHILANDGISKFYCSSKCRKNALFLKRDKRKVRWTESFKLVREDAIIRAKSNEAQIKRDKEEKKRRKEEKRKLYSQRNSKKTLSKK